MSAHFYLRSGSSTRSKVGLIALGVGAVAVGGVLLILGITLLIGLSALGLTLAAGAMLYRKVTGRSLFRRSGEALPRMDAALEVFPPDNEPALLERPKRDV